MKNKIKNKKVYVVRGSTDGNLGVYTTLPKAYECVMEYFNDYGNLSLTLKDIKDFHSKNPYSDINVYSGDTDSYCKIEPFFLNV
jgi:vesicle coat complex subunit